MKRQRQEQKRLDEAKQETEFVSPEDASLTRMRAWAARRERAEAGTTIDHT
jgi:hypothetical protein